MNIGMLSGKGKDVPECVYEFAFPTANSYMRPGNKPLFRGSIKNHNPRKGTETARDIVCLPYLASISSIGIDFL